MSSIVHVANTNVEFEMAKSNQEPLVKSISRNSLCLQLQFLPLLYAQPEDIIAVSALPDSNYLRALEQTGWWPQGLPQLALMNELSPFQGKSCTSWGASRQVKVWAEERHMHYACPEWRIAQLINSKAFSFRYQRLPQAQLIFQEKELANWMQKTAGPKVLKTCFGLSGKGNWRIDGSYVPQELLAFCQKEWQQNRPLIGEPWLDRVCDFSTQWFIHPNREIEWIGATRFDTDENGVYRGTLTGPEKMLFKNLESFLVIHRPIAEKALQEVADLGFFGSVGIDALIYRDAQNHSLNVYPIVEINGRKTMSWIALQLQKRICADRILRLDLQDHASDEISLLPSQIQTSNGKTIKFHKKLIATLH